MVSRRSAEIAHFGLGVAVRGSLKGRLAIPLHNLEGKLIGYAGRIIDDSEVAADNPRYLFPAKREREGKIFDFQKDQFLYNSNRVPAPSNYLVVVQGFESVWWLHQSGYPRVVAVMGSDCSDRQAELLVSLLTPKGKLWILPDGDGAGAQCAESILKKAASERFSRWARLPAAKQPADLSRAELEKLHKH